MSRRTRSDVNHTSIFNLNIIHSISTFITVDVSVSDIEWVSLPDNINWLSRVVSVRADRPPIEERVLVYRQHFDVPWGLRTSGGSNLV